MFILRNLMLGWVMFFAVSVANAAAIQVCSGSTSGTPGASGITSNCSLGSLSLLANADYSAELTVTPASGSVGAHFWNVSIFDSTSNSVLGYSMDHWVGDSPVTLSMPFTTLANTSSMTALISGWDFGIGAAQYSLIVTAVPEASVWIMMLGGAGLISLMLRNRKTEHPELVAA